MSQLQIGNLNDSELEGIVMQEFVIAEAEGFKIKRDCEVFLARRVAERLRGMAREAAHIGKPENLPK